MNSTLIACLATLLVIAVQWFVGRRMKRMAKPYGAVVLVAHIALTVAVLVGVSTINVRLQAAHPAVAFSVTSMGIAGGLLWFSILTGIVIAVLKKKNRALAVAHRLTMYAIALAIFVNSAILIAKA